MFGEVVKYDGNSFDGEQCCNNVAAFVMWKKKLVRRFRFVESGIHVALFLYNGSFVTLFT